jgi:diacylglycerol kinase (ATP)
MTWLRAFLRSFTFAGQGVWRTVRAERNMRVHLVAACAVILAAAIVGLSAVAWACVLLAIGLVLVAETFNTVVEAMTDMVEPRFHPLAKIAKDAAAGAVLLASLTAVGVAVAVFGSRLLSP